MKPTIHRSEFVRRLRETVPEVEPYLEGMRTGVTLEMSAFREMTDDALRRGDRELLLRAFQFAKSLLENGNREVRNALAVCFLEDLDLDGDLAA